MKNVKKKDTLARFYMKAIPEYTYLKIQTKKLQKRISRLAIP